MSRQEFVAIANRSRTRRHWSLTTDHDPSRPLCRTSEYGYTQEEVDRFFPPGYYIRMVVADLPLCKQCEKSRLRRIEGRPS